ncbi:peroxidase-like [Uloborus diversus]|uniref:peroxidase-like n=1 Tax=Uloborus diversus TaxID=327109 RepID=UPI002408F340|nr:peroxidase-like [Uloborus diversus]
MYAHLQTKKFGRTVFILYLVTVCQCQVTTWNIRNPNDILPSPGYISTGRTKDIPVLQPYSRAQQAIDLQDVYGPHLRRECPMNPEILDPYIIEATRKEVSSCSDQPISCYYAEYSKYRTIDGSCNNLRNPTWGKSDICLRRVLPFDYADRISYPRISCTKKPLPNPRVISNVFHREIRPKSDPLTTHFMEWGQMLAHDLTLNDLFKSPESGYTAPIDCCSQGPHISDMCYSFPVPPNDPFYPKFGVSCINQVRSMPCHQCSSTKRIHWNQNTAYHDLSLVYSSNEDEALKLRSGVQGMLDVEYNRKSGPMPPTVRVEDLCVSPPQEKSCYKTGDMRANQNPFLLTVHTYLLRHHNFICQELHAINPHWDDEKLYQEARRINIAQAQFITYGHYLPNVLGEIMEKEGIHILPGAEYTKYSPELDASIADEYSAWAARYGHTLIPGRFSEIDPKTLTTELMQLRDNYFTPFGFRYGQFDKVAKGMTVDRKMKHDVFLSDDIRNYLYRRLYLNETTGNDLASASIVRGRDHGIPGYTYYLSYFFNLTTHSFDDLRKMLPDKSVDLLEELYESVHDVDVYSAGLAEYYVPGGFVGPTFGAVLGQQYKRVKFGDRYWFEHANQAGSFNPDQLLEIKRTTLARILCETTRITEIQMQPFRPPSSSNPIVPCEKIHRFNFLLWKE